MSEHIHADIVRPDGSVGPISQQRAMKQPRKDVLREALAGAANRIEELARERDCWRDLAERAPQEAQDGPMPALGVLLLGAVMGGALVALAGWL